MSDVEVMASLGEVANEPIEQSGPPANSTFVYVDIGSVDKETKTIGDAKELTAEAAPSRAKQRLREGDVLVSMTRPNLNAVAIVNSQLDGAIGSTGFHVLRTRWMEPSFLYYLVQTRTFVEAMSSVVQGALYPAVRPADINKFQFRLPPRAEQSRIVEKLEELLGGLDAAVAELQAAQRKLALYRQSLLKAAVEGALTADWRAANGSPQEPAADLLQRILQERRSRWEQKQRAKFATQGKPPPKGWQAKYPEPVAPDTTGLPALPEEWVWASLDSLLEAIEAGKSFKCEERPPHDDEVGVVKVSAVTWGEYDENESKTCNDEHLVDERLFVRAGDFLFSRANTIELVGACVIAERVGKRVMLSDKILRFIFVEPSLDRLVLSLLRSKLGRKQIESLASGNQDSMRNIGQERIKQIAIPLPPLAEQHAITEHLDAALTACDAQQTAISHSLKQAAAQRRNLLKAAFAGQLVPQDPSDEPASALLERIRAARADNAGRTRAARKAK